MCMQTSTDPYSCRQSARASGKLSSLCTGHLYPRRHPCYSFMSEASEPQSQRAAGRIKSMKNPCDSIGNWICDHLACSTVPQPAVPLRMPIQSLEHLAVLVLSIYCLTYLHTYHTFWPRYVQCVILQWRQKVFGTLNFILKWHGWPPVNILLCLVAEIFKP